MGKIWHHVKLSDKCSRILETFPVPKAYQPPWSHVCCSINWSDFIPTYIRITSSIPAQLFSVGFVVIVRSLHNLTSLLWLQTVGNLVFKRVDFERHCKKLLYQNRKQYTCLLLFYVAEDRVTMKVRTRIYSSFSTLWITPHSLTLGNPQLTLLVLLPGTGWEVRLEHRSHQ